MRPLLPLAGAAVLLGLSACAAPATPGAGASATSTKAPVAIATTTQLGSILGDITACAGETSTTLMRPGTDPHDFALASDQVAAMTRAKLVVANGLGLEGGMAAALANVKADGGRVYEVAPDVDPLAYADLEADHAGEAGTHTTHEHGTYDPHVALDASRMARAATNIGAQLAEVTGNAEYTRCGGVVSGQINETDAEVRRILGSIPAERRVLVTDHEAFNYFAKAYDFRVAGVVIPGGSTDAEPSSSEIAAIVRVVQAEKVPAIFSNVSVNSHLIEAVAREAGADVTVVPLFVDSVGGPGSGAETYRALMTRNAELITAALT